jgi:Mg/Co/Ni transporter MgtE
MRSGIDNYGAISTHSNSQQYNQEDVDGNFRNSSQPLMGIHLEVSESSDASSQYSSKMDYLTPEDRRAGNDAERYLAQTMFHRAYPERSLALFVTLLLELPTLFIISGGSDQLCSLIGRRRYQLLVAFLPLTSAISGNVGLQASTLTTRAVSHLHVTKHSYCPWLLTEVGTAGYQGLGMGAVSGIFAYVASGQDFAFGITIFLAQFISILTAGFTGTLAPLIFTFLFQRDSGQWGGPLETAIQDIVGSFAMVVLSYHVLNWLGPHDIHESDVC